MIFLVLFSWGIIFQGNVAEAFYKNIDGALEEYNNAELYHGEEK